MNRPDSRPIRQPPWQARLAGFATFWLALGAAGLWGWPGFVAVGAVGLMAALALWHRLGDVPESFASFAIKVAGVVGAVVAVLWLALVLVGAVEPLWLGTFLALIVISAFLLAVTKLSIFEQAPPAAGEPVTPAED